jgi:oligopeptidase B
MEPSTIVIFSWSSPLLKAILKVVLVGVHKGVHKGVLKGVLNVLVRPHLQRSMSVLSRCLGVSMFLLVLSCSNPEESTVADTSAPQAAIKSRTLSLHGVDRIDDYYWIRDDTRSDPEVLELLTQENSYTSAMMQHTGDLQDRLFSEIAQRLSANKKTVPVIKGNFAYHQEFREGTEYPIYFRRQVRPARLPHAEIILDVNIIAKGHSYFSVGNWSVSPNDQFMAYVEDTVSRRQYSLKVKDLESGELLPDTISNVSTSIAWSGDSKTFFYVAKDPQTLLPNRVYRHTLGTKAAEDVLVYEEKDSEFYTSVYQTRSEKYIVISISSTDSSEIRLIPVANPSAIPTTFLAREAEHEYRIRHIGTEFYILTNWQANNFRLMKVREDQLGDKRRWREVIQHRATTLLQDVEVFDQFLVTRESSAGLSKLRVMSRESQAKAVVVGAKLDRTIGFPDPTYATFLSTNPDSSSTKLRYFYSSMTTPGTVLEYDMVNNTSKVLKQDEVLGAFDSEDYVSKRIFIDARDGKKVPVSLVYRKDKWQPGENPLYLNAYGSYGYSTDANFQSLRLSLLNRGFVYGIVHVRGGEELGRDWYEDGKLLKKRNTFWDFIDATDALVEAGYGAKDKVIAMGGSAGGLLMGVIANEVPEKYLAIVAHVPFVDVITTMNDPTIPLTIGEYTEWGNPSEKIYFDYMLSYSPYDQIRAQAYPHMFVTTGLHDSQVQYFEPVKWVSKLRKMKTGNNKLLMDINMKSGHGGSSDRYERYRTDALEYAFLLDVLDLDS